MEFIHSRSGPSNDFQDWILLILGSNKSEKPINKIGIDKNHSKADCLNGSIVSGI